MIKATVVNATLEIGHHGCALVCERIDELCSESGIDVTTWLPLSARVEQIASTKCDIVLVNGEGTLHHDRPGARGLVSLGSN